MQYGGWGWRVGAPGGQQAVTADGQEGPQSGEGWWWDDDGCRTERSTTACFGGSGAPPGNRHLWSNAPCPVVIRPSQTNMIEPRATLQWRQGHSLLLIVRNENPSIRRDSCSIYIFRLAAVVLDVPRKKSCKHAALLGWSASRVQI